MAILVHEAPRSSARASPAPSGRSTPGLPRYGPAGRWRHARQGRDTDPNGSRSSTPSTRRSPTGADATMIFVPPPFAADAILEAAPPGSTCLRDHRGHPGPGHGPGAAPRTSGHGLIGPNCPASSPRRRVPGEAPTRSSRWLQDRHHAGLHPPARSLSTGCRRGHQPVRHPTYEAVWQTSVLGIGQTTCVGIGGDPVRGTGFIDLVERFEGDAETDGIIVIGEIGGTDEIEAAHWIKEHVSKPVAAFIAGRTAPPGKRMGHAGAIIGGARTRPKRRSPRSASAGSKSPKARRTSARPWPVPSASRSRPSDPTARTARTARTPGSRTESRPGTDADDC